MRQALRLAPGRPVDWCAPLRLDPEETLVIVVSKTFTTAETMLNARTMKDWLVTSMKGKASPSAITSHHMVKFDTVVL